MAVFVQMVLGRAADAGAVRRQWDRWATDLAPGVAGFVGATGEVATDRRVVLITRFESEHAAPANAERPEQHRWWAETVTGALPTLKSSRRRASPCTAGSDGRRPGSCR